MIGKFKFTKFITISLIVLLMTIFIILLVVTKKERSLESFCRAYDNQAIADRRRSASNDELAAYFNDLNQHAPESISADTQKLADGYRRIKQDPEDQLSIEFSVRDAANNVGTYTKENCR